MDCIQSLSSNYVVKGQFTRSNGTVFTSPPAGFVYEWSSPAFIAPVYGDSVVLGPSTINSAALPSLKQLPLTFKVVDTATGIFFETLQQINFKSISVPSALFTPSFPEPGVVQVTLNSLTGVATRRIWDFGDGVTVTETHPAPHRYSRPGEYLIRHTATYGNNPENFCTRREEVLVTIDTADFVGQPCPTPLYLSVSNVASNNAKLKWESVFGANRYEFRARSVKFPDEAWLTGSKADNFIVIPGLDPNEEYEYQVRAICPAMATDTSDWSYPYLFKTPTCFAPINLAVNAITATTATVTWVNQSESVSNHEVLARAIGGGPLFRIPVAGGASALLTGLTPSTNYELAVRPRCPNASGGPGVAGDLTQKKLFTTLSPRELQSLTDETAMQLQPNPASDFVQIQLQGQGGTVRILDVAGKLVHQQGALSPVIELNVQNWEEGYYLVEWLTENGQAYHKKLLIQQD
jgi:PKD repeat protein